MIRNERQLCSIRKVNDQETAYKSQVLLSLVYFSEYLVHTIQMLFKVGIT